MSAANTKCRLCEKGAINDRATIDQHREVLKAYSDLRSTHAEIEGVRGVIADSIQLYEQKCKDRAERIRKAGVVESLKSNIIRLRAEVHKQRVKFVENSLEESALQEDLKQIDAHLSYLEQVKTLQSTIHGGLTWQIDQLRPVAEAARWRRILEYFVMFPIEVQAPKRDQTIALIGISTISGFPLPNNGVFSDLPVEAVISTLAIISQLLVFVADEWNVSLPNALAPFETPQAALIAPHYRQSGYIALSPVRMDVLSLRAVNFQATAAQGAISEKVRDLGNDERNEEFETAYRLLCDDVLVLCTRCGIQPQNLWPREAILLNLYELHKLALRVCLKIEQLTKRNQVTFTELPVELKRAVPRTATLSDRTQPLWDERFDEQLLYAPPAVKYRNQQPFSDDRLAESMVHVQSSDQLESSVCTVNAPDLDIGGIINVRSDDEDEWAIIEDEHERPPDHSVFRSILGDSAFFSTLFK